MFYAFVAFGAVLGVVGLVLVLVSLGQPFSLNNLRPAFMLLAGFLMFVMGVVVANMSIRIRWMRRVERKLDEALESRLEKVE